MNKRRKKAKIKRTSSIRLKRICAAHECTLECIGMPAILVPAMNLFIRKTNYPKRWLNLTEVRLEKGKGPVLGKLWFITLIEVDL